MNKCYIKYFEGFSLVETLIVISIISILIGIIIHVTLLYEKFNREWGFLSSTALDVKEIAIQIETNISTSYKLEIKSSSTVDKIILDDRVYELHKNLNNKIIKEIIYLSPYSIVSKEKEKKLKNEVYWKIEYENLRGYGYVYGISFYIYNRYAKKYRSKVRRNLVYFIVVHKVK